MTVIAEQISGVVESARNVSQSAQAIAGLGRLPLRISGVRLSSINSSSELVGGKRIIRVKAKCQVQGWIGHRGIPEDQMTALIESQ